MVVVEAARPPSGGDSPYAEAMSKKGKQSSVGSVASMKLLMRGVTSRDIFSRAPSRTASLNLRRTSGEEGSGSSAMQTMETIEHSASDASDTETVSRARGSSAVAATNAAKGAMKRTDSSVIRGLVGDAIDKVSGTETTGFAKTEEQRVKSMEAASGAMKRTDSSVIRGLVGDAIDKAAGTETTGFTKTEEQRVKSIEVMLSKREKEEEAEGESPAGEPSTAHLKAELAKLQMKRVVAEVDDCVTSIEVMLSKRGAESESPEGEPSSADLRAELTGLQVKRVAAVDAGVKSIELILNTRDAQGEAPAGGASTAALKAELAGLQVKHVATIDARLKSIEVMLSKRDAEGDAEGESPAGEPSSADLKSELAGLQVKRATAVAAVADSSVVFGAPALTKSEEERVKSIEVMLSQRDDENADEAPEGEPSTSDLKAELAGLKTKRVDSQRHSLRPSLPSSLSNTSLASSGTSSRATPARSRWGKLRNVFSTSTTVKGITRTDSSVVRGLVGDAIDKVSATETGFTKTEEQRVTSIEVMLSKRGAQGEAPAGEASLAALKAELAGLQVKRVAVVDARVKSIEVMLSKRGAQGEAPAGEASTDALKAELALLQVKRVAVVDARVKSIEVMLSKRDAQGEAPAGEASLAALKSELALLQVKRVAAVDERLKSIEVILSERGAQGEAPAGEASTAALHAELAGLQVKLVEAADARVTSIEVMLSERGTQGESSSGEPSTAALKAELANLQVKRVAAVDARVTSIEVMLSARDAGNESAAGEPSTAALRAELAGLLVPRVAFPEAKDALAPFDLVVTSPAVRGRGKSPLAPRPPAKFAAAPSSPPRLGVRPAVVFAGPGPGGQTQPRAPSLAPSHQRSQFGAMIDSSKRSSPSVGFGGALRFDFQQVSAPDPWSKRGRAMRRSFSRLSGVSGDDSRVSGSGPGPGTYDTQQHGAFGVQHVATKRSFPALSMGKAGRFAAYERETRPTLGFPGPDKYIAHPSVGAQIVSRCDTLPAIHFPREVRPLGAVDDTCDDDDNARGPGAYKYVPGLGVQFMSGRVTAPARGFTKAKRFRLETVSGDSCGGGDGDGNDEPDESEPTHETLTARPYNSVGDQASSLKRNAPMFGFGSSYREQAALVSLTKKQAKKLLAGRLGPGPKYDPGASAHGRQVLSTKANYPRLSFPNQTRWPRGAETEAGETPGPGTYCT